MNLCELADALRQAGVDSDRYVLVPLLKVPMGSMARPEGSVWLQAARHGRWEVNGSGVAPHYDHEGTFCSFDSEQQACEVFLREMTGSGEPFAAERVRFGADCVRTWWEDEVRIALEDPEVAADRVNWRKVWAEREAAGEPAMTVAELIPALVKGGFERDAVRIEGIDEIKPDDRTAIRIGRDELGRWYWGRWEHYRTDRFVIEYRFDTEGEFCRHYYDICLGPVWMTPALTLAQWRQQREVAAENHAEYLAALQRADEEEERRLAEPPTTPVMLGIRLGRRGVMPERYWIAGTDWRREDDPELRSDALYLLRDPQTDEWWVEERPTGGPSVVLRRFASQAEAFAAFEQEMTRTDTTPFAQDRA